MIIMIIILILMMITKITTIIMISILILMIKAKCDDECMMTWWWSTWTQNSAKQGHCTMPDNEQANMIFCGKSLSFKAFYSLVNLQWKPLSSEDIEFWIHFKIDVNCQKQSIWGNYCPVTSQQVQFSFVNFVSPLKNQKSLLILPDFDNILFDFPTFPEFCSLYIWATQGFDA